MHVLWFMRLRGLTCLAALFPLLLAACNTSPPIVTRPAAFTLTSADDRFFDFYSWDGRLIQRISTSLFVYRSWDGRYYLGGRDEPEHIFTRSGTDLGVIPNGGASGRLWAQDADFVCGTVVNAAVQSVMYVTDVHGKTREIPTDGRIRELAACSITTNRAAVYSADGVSWDVRSLRDGHVLAPIPVTGQADGFGLSADLSWLTVTTGFPGGAMETIVYRLSDGSVSAKLPDVWGQQFTPDSRYLLVNNLKLNTYSMLDWRTGHVVWTRAGYLRGAGESDSTTNMMLLQVAADQSAEASQKQQFWIVSPTGVFTQFHPRE